MSSALVAFGIFDDWSFEEAFSGLRPEAVIVGVDGSVSASDFRSLALTYMKEAFFDAVRADATLAAHKCRGAAHLVKKSLLFQRFFGDERRRFHRLFLGRIADRRTVTWSDLWRHDPLLQPARTVPLSTFVKMDIEGAEYDVLHELISDENWINGMVVEFHDCDVNWDRFAAIMDAMGNCFGVVHVHGNNFSPLIPNSAIPTTLEISFVNRRLLPDNIGETTATYPRPGLDYPCDRSKPDYPIDF